METVCKKNQCAGCMACMEICPTKSISIDDKIEYMNAIIDKNTCINCKACYRVCQKNTPPKLKKSIKWYQGWAEKSIRENSSSGGFATALMQTFVNQGGVVAACRFKDGDFRFTIARELKDLKGFSGSKYVKSNPLGIYTQVLTELKHGYKVLFIGMPCQVSAIKNYVSPQLREKLYTIDLICHGTPSVKLLKRALVEYGYDINNVNALLFRRNNNFGLETDKGKVVPQGILDRYTIAFLKGFCYTENCYSCDYATERRVGDITLGDSWGTEYINEEKNGVSLALIQSEKGENLIKSSGVTLLDVDLESAIKNNHQLHNPTEKGKEHDKFFSAFYEGKSFKKSVLIASPKKCIKQDIKEILVKLNL